MTISFSAIYTNLIPMHDTCDNHIAKKDGRYIVTKTSTNDMVHIININNGAQAIISKEYFIKEFEIIS